MTDTILTGPGIRDWDSPETKALYWSGACYALVSAIGLYGCKTQPLRTVLLKAHTEAYRHLPAPSAPAWTATGTGSLPSSSPGTRSAPPTP